MIPKDKLISVKYIGKRNLSTQCWEGGRKYCFSPINNFICEIPVSMYEFLAQEFAGQYEVVVPEVKTEMKDVEKIVIVEEVKQEEEVEKKSPKFKCECGFISMTKAGLKTHERYCKK